VLGTLQQEDRQALDAARRTFRFAAEHADFYWGMRSLARTCLLYPQRSYAYSKSTPAPYRGAFRILTEHQVPFDCAHDLILDEAGADELRERYDLLVLPEVACLSDHQAEVVDAFVERGGRVLATGATALYTEQGRPREAYALACLGAARVVTTRPDMRSAYWRVNAHDVLPDLPDTDLVFLDGAMYFVQAHPGATSSLALVPPCTYGPPEKVAIDLVESDVPGIVWYEHGAGRSAYLPWGLDALYYRHSNPGHDGLYYAVLLALCPEPQVLADAGPQLELALLAHREQGYLLNMINLSGHHGTAFFAPVPLREIEVQVLLQTQVHSARSLQLDQELPFRQEGRYTVVRLPVLNLFDTIYLL